ncbi:hypothetical protein [Nannocystis pusilla]|uniref:hypothetical protein n=1 Tax=Nannocystis pusilla TaxID=889268 RepID=UPI003DA38B4E
MRLNTAGFLADLEQAHRLSMNDLQVLLYASQDHEVTALLVHDEIWRAVPDWSILRRPDEP